MNFIFYDLETTGRNICWDQILQIGAILTNEKFEVLDSFEAKCYLKPGHIPSPTALLVNKTTAENLNKTNLSHYNLIQQIEKNREKLYLSISENFLQRIKKHNF